MVGTKTWKVQIWVEKFESSKFLAENFEAFDLLMENFEGSHFFGGKL